MTIGLRIPELLRAESELNDRARKRKAANDYLLEFKKQSR